MCVSVYVCVSADLCLRFPPEPRGDLLLVPALPVPTVVDDAAFYRAQHFRVEGGEREIENSSNTIQVPTEIALRA